MSAAIAFFAWRRRPAAGATALTWLVLAGGEWSLVYAVEMGSLYPPAKVFLSQLLYLGVVSVPVLWFILAVQYTGRAKWLTRRNLLLLAILPLCTLLLAWTNGLNDGHGLIWREIKIDTTVSPAVWDLTYGSFFWVSVAYSYLLVLSGSILIFQALIRSPQLYRRQAVALLVAALAPLAGNALYISGLNPFSGLDLTPFAFTLTGLAMAWALFRFRLLDVVPVAYEAIIKSMSDGMIVLDAQNRIVDLNPAAEQIIGRLASETIGLSVAQALSARSDLVELVERYQDETEARVEIVLGEGEAERYYHLRISSLYDRRGRLTGRLLVSYDITERKWAEAEQGRLLTALGRRSTQLQAAAEVSRAASSILGLDELLRESVNLIRDHFDLYYVGLFLVDEAGEWAVLHAGTGKAGQMMLKRGHKLEVGGDSMIGSCIADRRARIALDAGQEVVRFVNPLLPETRSEMSLPLMARGQVIGALTVQSEREGAFSKEDISILQAMVAQVANAIQNARLFESERVQLRLAQTLQEVGALLTTRMNLDEVFERIFDLLAQVVEYDNVSVQLLAEDGSAYLGAARGFPD
jgi:PAS domain S-box-containing protein